MTEPDLSTIVKVYPSKILRPILTVVIAVVIVWYAMTISISSIVIIIFFVLYILFELVLSVVVLFSRIIVTENELIQEYYFPIKHQKVIPYSTITRIQGSISMRYAHLWILKVESNKNTIVLNRYSHWKDILRYIYPRVKDDVFPDYQKKAIGVK
ncbi:MAG: hypothetical protein WAV76_03790 [Bacteroidota bacterium]